MSIEYFGITPAGRDEPLFYARSSEKPCRNFETNAPHIKRINPLQQGRLSARLHFGAERRSGLRQGSAYGLRCLGSFALAAHTEA
ncbi:hypothetical protein [Kaistia granuli]|uniref:hypothetical protein n=1 Tax=Kaistia granuli TaxID=363259 RepID=UPI0012EB1E03|nr:hypothetical protein [Kaistia granuli]